MKNLTLLDAGANVRLWDSNGTEDCYFEHVIWKRTTTPIALKFILIFGDAGQTHAANKRLIFENCHVTGDTFGEDMWGAGQLFYCNVSHNVFTDSDGRGIAYNVAEGTTFNDNIFINIVQHCIAAEGSLCLGNTVNNNIGLGSGPIKLSDVDGASTAHVSVNNVCKGNVSMYGDGGIKDGHGTGDIIEGNIIYRTQRYGIWGGFDRCIIANNQLIDCNYESTNAIITGESVGEHGGIVLWNNAEWTIQKQNNIIYGNHIQRTDTEFTVPVDYPDGGTPQTAEPGGILIDSQHSNTHIYNNVFDGFSPNNIWLEIINRGTNTKIWNNVGYTIDNTGIKKLPSVRRQGSWIGIDIHTWSGIFAKGMTNASTEGSVTEQFDTTHGRNLSRTTAASVGANAGWRYPRTFTQRSFNPRMKAKFKLVQTGTGQRLFIGFRNDIGADASNDDDPLNGENGFMLALRSSDTTFQIASNDGTGATVFTAISGATVDTNVHTIEIIGDQPWGRWGYIWDNGAPVWEITDAPGQTATLGVMFMIQSQSGVAKSLDQYYLEVESDN